MYSLYPLKLEPLYKEYLWGGNNLREKFNKKVPNELTRCAESWEISSIQDNISIVSNGYLAGNNLQELIEVYMGELVGDKVYEAFGDEFPLLIKLIDATDTLSIQVHPDDATAKKRHHAFGKTEMWYIIDSKPGSQIITGLNQTLTKDEFRKHLDSNTLKEVLNIEEVFPGDYFFIPAGRIHAIGKGILLAEIQQTSDVTYRLYDWGRLDKNGKPRELHTDLALDVIDFKTYDNYKSSSPSIPNKTSELVKCDYFNVNRLMFNKSIGREYHLLDSFVIYLCIEGCLEIIYDKGLSERICAGETILIPAELKDLILKPINSATILEIFIK